jgi:hypothetical protein
VRRDSAAGLTGVLVALLLVPLLAASAPAPLPGARTVSFSNYPISHFQIGSPAETRFGRLRFLGGFEFEGDTRLASGLSGLAVMDKGRRLLAVSDAGMMLTAEIERAGTRPVGLVGGRLRAVASRDARAIRGPREADAEGLDVLGDGEGGQVAVSFETIPRVMTGRIGADGFPGLLDNLALPADVSRLPLTKGLEALAWAPAGGPYAGQLLVVAERPLPGEAPDHAGWILGTDGVTRFSVAGDGFDITDAAFGPDGDLYLLGRRFTLGEGQSARLRRIARGDLRPGSTVDGTELLVADDRHQIDNMEALAVWSDPQGRVVIALVSDDNASFLQRSLYLEFELEP